MGSPSNKSRMQQRRIDYSQTVQKREMPVSQSRILMTTALLGSVTTVKNLIMKYFVWTIFPSVIIGVWFAKSSSVPLWEARIILSLLVWVFLQVLYLGCRAGAREADSQYAIIEMNERQRRNEQRQ